MKKERGNNQMNEDNLDELAFSGSRISPENPFKVPDSYFESLNAEVMKKISVISGLEESSSENPFITPDGYFDSLPYYVQQRISEKRSRSAYFREWFAQIFIRPVPKYTLAFASLALIVLLSTEYFTRTIGVSLNAPQLSDSEQLDAAYLAQLDESTLADVLTEETSPVTDAQDQGIENYLLDNDIDLNSITEKL